MVGLFSPRIRLSDSPLPLYLSEVNETPLLDAEGEQDLAGRVQEGDPEARDHLVRANLRLVIRIARDFLGRGVSLEDLIQEGNLGLMRAAEAFDPTMGNRFSTYAAYWIRQSIQRLLDSQSTSIQIPAYAVSLVVKWRRMTARLEEELGRRPSKEEVAIRLNLRPRQLRIIEKALRVCNSTERWHASEESESFTIDLPDTRAQAPDTQMRTTDELQQVLGLLDTLPERDAAVLRLRFGLGGENPLTLKEIGIRFNLTRERVRQIEHDSLRQLRDKIETADLQAG